MVLNRSLASFIYISATLASLHLVSADFSSRNFALRDSFVGWQFLNGFVWETIDDPTHGRVNYVDRETALRRNLTYGEYPKPLFQHLQIYFLRTVSDSKFVMRVDHENVVQPGSRGRDSNRIRSYSAYSDSVIVIDVQHMPEGCGTWPAFWTLSASGPWPNGGEIDIIEGISCFSTLYQVVNRYSPIVIKGLTIRHRISPHSTQQKDVLNLKTGTNKGTVFALSITQGPYISFATDQPSLPNVMQTSTSIKVVEHSSPHHCHTAPGSIMRGVAGSPWHVPRGTESPSISGAAVILTSLGRYGMERPTSGLTAPGVNPTHDL